VNVSVNRTRRWFRGGVRYFVNRLKELHRRKVTVSLDVVDYADWCRIGNPSVLHSDLSIASSFAVSANLANMKSAIELNRALR